jgi:uncharacterized delta-60 repeat protein
VNFPTGPYNTASVSAVAIQPDGRVVLAGTAVTNSFFSPGRGKLPGQTTTETTFAVARLTADGRPDITFGDGGRATAASGGASAVGLRSDGGVVAAGGGTVAVFTPDGRLDTGYDGDGLATLQGAGGRALIRPDGGVVFTGFSADLSALTPTGQPDPAFGPGGRTTATFVSQTNFPLVSVGQYALLPDGRVLAAVTVSGDRSTSAGSSLYRLRGTAGGGANPPAGSLALSGTADGSAQVVAPVDGQFARTGGLTAFPDFAGQARTVLADVSGDGIADLIVGAGPGGGPNVQLFDGVTGAKFANLDVFEQTFRGGVFVAAADLTGDGKAEVVVTADQGGGPVVAIFDGAGLAAGTNGAAQLTRFFGIEDTGFRGGARPAVGDVNGDGKSDLLVAAGFSGGPRLAVFDGRRVLAPVSGSQLPPKLTGDFFVFEDTLRNGVFVTSGDLTGDGAAEVIVGGGPGGGPRVFALDGKALVGGTQTPVANFFAGDSNNRGGVRVAVTAGADGSPQLVTGSGDGEAASVRVYTAAQARSGGSPAQTLDPFGGAALADGVFVG